MSHALAQKTPPKQAEALLSGRAKVTTYESTGGKTTAKFAQHNLSLIAPIPAGSTVHDNCSGSGTVSRLVLAQQPDVKIYATDIDQPFLDVLSEEAAQKSWPVETSNQRSEGRASMMHSSTTTSPTSASSFGRARAQTVSRKSTGRSSLAEPR